jgi:hypothetical protein
LIGKQVVGGFNVYSKYFSNPSPPIDLNFPSVALPDQKSFETYLRGTLADLEEGQRASIERQLRKLEVDQKIGHGIYVLSKPKNVPWRSNSLFEYFSQFDDCSLPSPIPDPLRPDHMIDPAKRHLSAAINPVYDSHFFPSVTKDGPPPVCDQCGKRVMNEANRVFHNRFVHPSDVQQMNQERYGLGMNHYNALSLSYLLEAIGDDFGDNDEIAAMQSH